MKVKICGMREVENIRKVAEQGPDLMGFIFYVRSPRYVGENFIMPDLSETIGRVGVFVNVPLYQVLGLAQQYGLEYVQLHGEETPALCAEIRSAGLKVLKAFGVDSTFDFEQTRAYEGVADFFLFDTKGENYGGHGKPFDWNCLLEYRGNTPFFVAGGVSNENIGELLKLAHPMLEGIDVNSRYEISPGVKDVERVREMFLEIKGKS